MINCILVGAGGFIGAVMRYLTIKLVHTLISTQYAAGILLANSLGALAAGFLSGFFDHAGTDSKWRLLMITGLLGGYTTFSSYSLETVRYFMEGNIKYGISNIFLNNVLSLLLALTGLWLNRLLMVK
jgi:CrcB protein